MNGQSAQPAAKSSGRKSPPRRFLYLLIAQVLLVGLYPYFAAGGSVYGAAFFRALGVAALLSGVYAVSSRRRNVIIGLVLAVPATIVGIASANSPGMLTLSGLLCGLAFLLFTTSVVLFEVLTDRQVTWDTLCGAVSGYMLVALAWAAAYAAAEFVSRGSFIIIVGPNHPVNWPDLVYFSFITLATVGYGDVAAISPTARSLVTLESIAGVMYLAVLMARLVGLYQRRAEHESLND